MGNFYWMAVTADQYELPLVVADSSAELARLLGISQSTVLSQALRRSSGRNSSRRIVKVRKGAAVDETECDKG